MAAISTVIAGISAAAGIASAANSMRTSRRMADAAGNVQQVADPFAEMRPEFQQQLRAMFPSLISLDPNDVASDPYYQFMKGEGTRAIDNAASSAGLTRSGNRLIELARYAEGLAGQFGSQRFNQQMQILSALGGFAGANAGSPAAAAQTILGAQSAAGNWMTQGLNGIGTALGQFPWNRFGGGSTSIGYGTIDPTQAATPGPW